MCQCVLVCVKASRLAFIRNWVYFLKHSDCFNEHLMNAVFHLSCLCLEDVKLTAAIVNEPGAAAYRREERWEISALNVNPHIWDPSHELRKRDTKAQTMMDAQLSFWSTGE